MMGKDWGEGNYPVKDLLKFSDLSLVIPLKTLCEVREAYLASSASIASVTTGEFGSTSGEKRATTSPSRLTRKLLKVPGNVARLIAVQQTAGAEFRGESAVRAGSGRLDAGEVGIKRVLVPRP